MEIPGPSGQPPAPEARRSRAGSSSLVASWALTQGRSPGEGLLWLLTRCPLCPPWPGMCAHLALTTSLPSFSHGQIHIHHGGGSLLLLGPDGNELNVTHRRRKTHNALQCLCHQDLCSQRTLGRRVTQGQEGSARLPFTALASICHGCPELCPLRPGF